MARMAAFWSLAVLLFYGCSRLNAELAGRWTASLGSALIGSVPHIPVLGVELTGAFLISTVVFAAGMYALYTWLERPKSADLLIETEQELRKVTWPTGAEVINSSIVVIACVLFLMGYLAVADWFLARVARTLLFGGG
jgi:preprotein translocase SecE subunit